MFSVQKSKIYPKVVDDTICMHSWNFHTPMKVLLNEQQQHIMIHSKELEQEWEEEESRCCKRKSEDEAKAYLIFLRVCKWEDEMKNFITHSYCGIMNSFTDCFL